MSQSINQIQQITSGQQAFIDVDSDNRTPMLEKGSYVQQNKCLNQLNMFVSQ